MLIAFSHKYKKNDTFLHNFTKEDFDTVRDPLYKYNKIAQQKFFDEPIYAYLFVHFSRGNTDYELVSEKPTQLQ